MPASIPEGNEFTSEVDDKGNPLLLFDAILKNYQGMTFREAMRLTLPQVILLNHSAAVNKERGDEFYEWKESLKGGSNPDKRKSRSDADASSKTEEFEGKKVCELDSDSFARYFWAGIS